VKQYLRSSDRECKGLISWLTRARSAGKRTPNTAVRALLFALCLASPAISQTINTSRMLAGVNYQTGTTYSFQPVDTTYLVSFSNASAIAACLSSPQSACSGITQPYFFSKGSIFSVVNTGAGTVTITCSSCTINGSATLTLATGQGVDIYGDGVNFGAVSGISSGYGPGSSPTFDNVTVTGTCSGCSFGFTTTGLGWFFGGQSWGPIIDGVGGAPGSTNVVNVVQLELTTSFDVSKISTYVITGGGAGYMDCALYNSAGTTKLLDCGTNAFNTHSASQSLQSVTATPTTVGPGVYWYAWGSTDGNGSVILHQPYQYYSVLFNANVARAGTAANHISAGAMPATLGTITPLTYTGSAQPNIPAVMFQN
jgi:hypothetical protein